MEASLNNNTNELDHDQADNEDEAKRVARDNNINHEIATPASSNTEPIKICKRSYIKHALMEFIDPHKVMKNPGSRRVSIFLFTVSDS